MCAASILINPPLKQVAVVALVEDRRLLTRFREVALCQNKQSARAVSAMERQTDPVCSNLGIAMSIARAERTNLRGSIRRIGTPQGDDAWGRFCRLRDQAVYVVEARCAINCSKEVANNWCRHDGLSRGVGLERHVGMRTGALEKLPFNCSTSGVRWSGVVERKGHDPSRNNRLRQRKGRDVFSWC